ncbi:MAG: isochorismate synthase MenF [Bacillus sp. (in: firmicutes)]
MAIVLETQLLEGLQKALRQANETNSSILFSNVAKTHALSPLSFYSVGREYFFGERFFWQDASHDTVLVGLGKVDIVQLGADQNRFEKIEEHWKSLLTGSVIIGDDAQPASGPIMFGGLSFDHEKSSSILWKKFGDNFFYVPQYMVTVQNNCTYLTTNILCTPGSNLKHCVDIVKNGEQLLHESKKEPIVLHANVCVEKQEIQPESWKQQVAQAVETITSTSIDKIVLAREMRLTFEQPVQSEAVLARLLEEQPTSYIYSLEVDKDCFIGASPERLVKKEETQVLSTCLAGSIARGKTKEEDDELGQYLLHDPKNVMEHQYVVSMIQNALESECYEVNVPNKPILMKIKHIQHLYTPVTAQCKQDISIFRLVNKLHPTPALGGLPKQQAVEWIRQHESLERGMYSAPIGWVDAYGNGEFAVGIRSALLQEKEASLFAGCGVVKNSVPEEEYEETKIKFQPMLNALGGVSS